MPGLGWLPGIVGTIAVVVVAVQLVGILIALPHEARRESAAGWLVVTLWPLWPPLLAAYRLWERSGIFVHWRDMEGYDDSRSRYGDEFSFERVAPRIWRGWLRREAFRSGWLFFQITATHGITIGRGGAIRRDPDTGDDTDAAGMAPDPGEVPEGDPRRYDPSVHG